MPALDFDPLFLTKDLRRNAARLVTRLDLAEFVMLQNSYSEIGSRRTRILGF